MGKHHVIHDEFTHLSDAHELAQWSLVTATFHGKTPAAEVCKWDQIKSLSSVGKKNLPFFQDKDQLPVKMLVGNQVICEMLSLEMTSLVAGSIDNQIFSATLTIFLFILSSQLSHFTFPNRFVMLFRCARIEAPPLSRHPSCQTPSKRQTSPDTVPTMFGSDPTGAWWETWMEWHPAGFLYYGSLSRCLTLRKIQFIIFIETLKHYHPYHRKVQNLWKITWKRKSWPPEKKSISKDSHWNWFVLLSPYPPNECWPRVRFLEASPPGR